MEDFRINPLDFIWVAFLLLGLQPMIQRRWIAAQRVRLMQKIERQRGSRVVTIIHRQEALALLGFPVARFIDIEDSEAVLRAIRLTPAEMPLDLIVHTPGGLVLASEQIARALCQHKGKVTVFVPHYAMSGGTLLALAADEIRMDEPAIVERQLGAATAGKGWCGSPRSPEAFARMTWPYWTAPIGANRGRVGREGSERRA